MANEMEIRDVNKAERHSQRVCVCVCVTLALKAISV